MRNRFTAGSAIAACANRSCFGAKRLVLASATPGRLRKKVIWKPQSRPCGSRSHPVTYHHSLRNAGCAPSSFGNASVVPGSTSGYVTSPRTGATMTPSARARNRRRESITSAGGSAFAATGRPEPRIAPPWGAARRRRVAASAGGSAFAATGRPEPRIAPPWGAARRRSRKRGGSPVLAYRAHGGDAGGASRAGGCDSGGEHEQYDGKQPQRRPRDVQAHAPMERLAVHHMDQDEAHGEALDQPCGNADR